MILPLDQFIDRLLCHVPKPRAIMVRSWGLFANSKKDDLALCRAQLGQLPVEEKEFLDWQTLCSRQGDNHPERCPVCGRLLVCTDVFGPEAIPPGDELLLRRVAWWEDKYFIKAKITGHSCPYAALFLPIKAKIQKNYRKLIYLSPRYLSIIVKNWDYRAYKINTSPDQYP